MSAPVKPVQSNVKNKTTKHIEEQVFLKGNQHVCKGQFSGSVTLQSSQRGSASDPAYIMHLDFQKAFDAILKIPEEPWQSWNKGTNPPMDQLLFKEQETKRRNEWTSPNGRKQEFPKIDTGTCAF